MTSGPGKTSPRLFQDFLIFDPQKTARPNGLTDHPPPHGEGPQHSPLIGSCKHEYAVKFSQSVPPPLDLRPDGSTTYKLAVVCKKCRIHADVRIDYSNSTNSCPTSDNPLHHFQRVPSYDKVTQDRIRYAWQCSVPDCSATLFISFRRPRISAADYDLLTNPEHLRSRYDALVKQDPNREGIKPATPMDSLTRLRRYIKDMLNTQHNRKSFPANNKRFQEAFGVNGQDCRELLERLGFKYADIIWYLPELEPSADPLQTDGNSPRELLEDVEMELLAHMIAIASETGLVNPHAGDGWSSANRDIERALAAQGYPRHVSSRRAWENTEVPFFNSLGALPDFADSVVEYTYDRQTICDPERTPYYFECLKVITDERRTEQLQMKVATLESQDLVSRRDLNAAYKSFSIPLANSKDVADERIIELFQAQQPDLGSAAQEEARANLYKIGVCRQSSMLINASRQSIETYEDALRWLGNGVDDKTPDESILAVLAIRTADSIANEEIGQKAIAAIAKARKSNMLNDWLITGRTDGWTMSVDEALRLLNIDQKLDDLDPTMLPALFESARQDKPGESTNKAIATIQQALTNNGESAAPHPPATWPVGLTSHGNTCYLNSLLQYYFSVKPIRDIILNYDKYKLDTAACAEKGERVGQRKISMVEINGGQKFAEDLKHLFERMIKDPGSAVKPEEDLVCRAFLEPKDYRLLAPNVRDLRMKNADNTTVNGIGSGAEEKLSDADTVMSPTETLTGDKIQSDASSSTLQASVNGDDPNVPMKNVEMPPTPPASPGLKGQELKPLPEQAPPLPPRRFSTTKEEALNIAKQNARQQQDVTEVHDGAMFRLRCGMMPMGQDANGEQEDALRALFSMRIAETPVKKGVQQKAKLLTDTSIQLDVPYEATDIYSALDAVFDLQMYSEDPAMETFKSIRDLPPLLQINIPRIGFDLSRPGGGAYKSNECVRLVDELYLDRYYDTCHPSVLPKRRECWGWRKQLQVLRREQKVLSKTLLDLDGPTTVAETAKYLTRLDEVNQDLKSVDVEPIEADGEITSALTADAEQEAERVVELNRETDELQKRVNAQFEDMRILKYRLAAVFFHRGGHGHGHYWIYIHDFASNMWRSYNDERVEEFTKMEDIFEAKTWQQGTPTYAVYVKEENIDIVQTVCRDPEKPPTPEPVSAPPMVGDVWMGDAESQNETQKGVDPKMVMEGGQASWDDSRQMLAEARW